MNRRTATILAPGLVGLALLCSVIADALPKDWPTTFGTLFMIAFASILASICTFVALASGMISE
jgi:hypothetical protein